MYISKNWLKQYVFLPDSLDNKEFKEDLTLHTVEVEGYEDKAEMLNNIVVGEVKSVEKHPDADTLKVCKVFDGEEEVDVVCGGTNVVKGMKVAFGKIGAKVHWHGEEELVELKKTKIRGVTSFGMICASSEIGLQGLFPTEGEKEILDLSHVKEKAGTPVAKALHVDDVVFDVDNKSMTHRPDLWGHYGLAREVAAMYRKKLEKYEPKKIQEGTEVTLKVDVEDKFLCPRYMAVQIDGVEIAESPAWLKDRLMSVGLRPINNIVDITNYIMYDIGQPLHSFDATTIVENIIVRRADDGEKFITLDGEEHTLTNEMLLIADAKKAIALAGVMGGENSGIADTTTQVIFESANFDPVSVRKTALSLGIRTDSSARFEKSLDPNMTEIALRRAVELTLELCPNAKVVSNIADEKNFQLNQGPIEVSLEFLKKKIGMDIEKKVVMDIFERLGFEVKEKKDIFFVTVPTWRATKDISIPEDLVEEVARMFGYDNIPTSLPVFPVVPPLVNTQRKLEHTSRNVLSHECGATEVYNYSYVSPGLLQKCGIDEERYVELENPLQKDRPFLRRHLFVNMMDNIEKNLHRYDEINIFEIGKTYLLEEPGDRTGNNGDLLPRQDTYLGIAYAKKGNNVPFFIVRSALERLFAELGVSYEIEKNEERVHSYVHGGRTAKVKVEGTTVGRIFEIHPSVSDALGIETRVAVAEINLVTLNQFVQQKNTYKPVSQYPEIVRDIAFVVPTDTEHAQIVKVVQNIDPLLVSFDLFDVYEGMHVEQGKKSMAYRITYRSDERTLTTDEVESIHKKVLKALEKEVDAEMRK
ncbi:MAG: phenylalanine--tRNA ligase subunit beta [Candidatus Magasanikbacteria bacterium]